MSVAGIESPARTESLFTLRVTDHPGEVVVTVTGEAAEDGAAAAGPAHPANVTAAANTAATAACKRTAGCVRPLTFTTNGAYEIR